jgi:hypothetical protein
MRGARHLAGFGYSVLSEYRRRCVSGPVQMGSGCCSGCTRHGRYLSFLSWQANNTLWGMLLVCRECVVARSVLCDVGRFVRATSNYCLGDCFGHRTPSQ